ncbi:MAG: hypothetical protein CL434_02260 [Acidimicrobiaceae bacterium]|nr:hypothetical protein [Acidimicrobiaceae bacterium]
MRKMFMAYLLLFSQVAWVAENAPQQPTEDQGSEEAVLDNGVTPEEVAAGESDDLVSDNEGNEQEVEEERQSSGRFIPTEQISQDLGVSFPVDI